MASCVLGGFIWTEIKQMWDGGLHDYIHDWWNLMDFVMNSLYLATISLKIVAYLKYSEPKPRSNWEMWHPTLVAEALFAIANIFSSLRLISLFTANSHLGPLQISLGRMLLDILKFLFIYCLVLLAFANGLNQLYFHYEFKDEGCKGVRCERQNNAFSTLFETLQSLFWSIFGLINLYVTNVQPEHVFTEFVGATMFGTYNIISLVVLLNMLIAMMNNSYQHIADHADIEWKFARTKLWMSYFEEGGTLPTPFNIVPSPKSVWYLIQWIRRNILKEREKLKETFGSLGRRAAENVRIKNHYQEVLRNLVKRYVAAMIRDAKTEEGLTEENFKELKQDISSFRYEVMGMMKGNRRCVPALSPRDAACGFSNPDHLMPYVLPATLGPSSPRAKLNLYEVTTILQHHHHHHHQGIMETPAPTTAEPGGSLVNGTANPPQDEACSSANEPLGLLACSPASSSSASTSSQERASRKDFPRDISNFGLFQKSQGRKSVRGPSQSSIYSLSEEADESDREKTDGKAGGEEEGGEEEEGEVTGEDREEGTERLPLPSQEEGEEKKRMSREKQSQEVEEEEDGTEAGTQEKDKTEPLLRRDGEGSGHSLSR
ncbi:hypothetical protein ACEWY4_008735 [Coilia grayii]|uniref:Ion transport domain-containing protein n=1 Tax=Coilia grayii TaxID=363190 RepID=A0ABD1KBW0_9TELE